MKKVVSFICLLIMVLSVSLTAFAGSVPEDLIFEDGAQIFFAEVLSYHPNKEKPDMEFSPIKKIKGDVKTGTKQIAYNINKVGDFKIVVGKVYLFTYFDENNPTDIFETTTQDTKTLKLKNTTGDMWERFEKNLNDGLYEKAELKRLGKLEDYEKVKNAQTMQELFVLDKNDVERMEVVYAVGEKFVSCYIDKDKFFDLAKTVSLEPYNRIDPIQSENGLWLVAYDKDGERYEVWLDKRGRLGCPKYVSSSAVTTQFDLNREDYIKIYAFLPEEATAHIPLENPMIQYIPSMIIVFAAAFIIGFLFKKKGGQQSKK